MKSYKENWKKLIGIGVVALAALLVLIGIGMVYHEKVKRDAGKGDQILIENFGETLSGEYSTEELMEMIRFVRDHFHMTILLIEQNANMALKVAHQAYVLETGKITMSGTGQELLENPDIKAAYLGKKRNQK